MGRSRDPFIDDGVFWARVNKLGPVAEYRPELGLCWIWEGSCVSSTGYGAFRQKSSHVVAYVLAVGPVPDGLEIDHLCRRRICCNPAHLEAVTHAENNRRAREHIVACPAGHPYNESNTRIRPSGWRECRACHRDRQRKRARAAAIGRPDGTRRGEAINTSKLSVSDVLEIRRVGVIGENSGSLARRYGVTSGAIRKIIRGETWAHLLPASEAS